ncbi:MAG: GNAT family N-acetyltransferase [Oscillospiraceae bacterium]|nr:GNAT family N-acetyltransferase [Oscillospiraceae bacterium]
MTKSTIRERLAIKPLEMEHLAQFNDLLRYAFQVTNQELSEIGWEEDEIRQAKSPVLKKADVLGWFDGDKLASQIAVYPMKVNVHGKIYSMGGVTGVATYPEYAAMGLMHDLMMQALEDMRRRGQSISFLYPYSIPFYRKKGWEIVSDKMTFTIKDTQLPKRVEVPGMVERVPQDHEDFKKLYSEFSAQRHGALQRDDLAWEEYWRWDVDDMIVAIYYDGEHRPTGYVVYLLENDTFKIKEIVYLNQEARHGIWNYISAHFSMVDSVKGDNFTGEAMAFLLEDSEIKETICPYIMARIVDVERFLRDFPFAAAPAGKKIHLKLTDPMAAWNQDDFSIAWNEDGEAVCTRGSTEGEEVRIDIQTLTTMLMSYRRPSYLARIERLHAAPRTVKLLEQVIPSEQPYFSDYF